MKYFNKVVLAVAVGCVLAALPVVAQPGGGGGGGRGGFGGGMGGGLTPEQVLGLLAFDDKFAVTDKQLVALRAGLKESYAKQREMMEELMGGDVDWQAMREKMREGQAAMRTEVMEIVAGVLSAEQMDTLKRHIAEAQERRGGMGGNRGGTRGGGGDF